MAMDLLDRIPTEILLEVLGHLKFADLATCKQACWRLCEVADYILSVRYAEELENEGFEDSGGPLANEEKLRRLEAYKHFWKTAEGDLVNTFTISSTQSLENIPGALSTTVLAEASTGYEITLRQIPSRIFGVPPRHWTLGPFPFRILALAIDQAQELLIAASYPTLEDPHISLHFLYSETGKQHPRATTPSIKFPVVRYAYQEYNVHCKMVIHRHMVAITFDAIAGHQSSGGLRLMNWNSGELLMDVQGDVSRGLAFVDGRYIIVHSCIYGCEHPVLLVFDVLHPPPLQFDLWDPDMNLSYPLVVLHLPTPPDGHEMIYRDDTIWTCDDHAYPKSTFPPFTPTTGEDIVAVHLGFLCNTPDGCFPNPPQSCNYCNARTMWIVISKQPLLDIIKDISAAPLPSSANNNLRLVSWQTWGIGARIVETDGREPHPPVHGSCLFIEAWDRWNNRGTGHDGCTVIYDLRVAPLRRDPTLAYETAEEEIPVGVVQHVPCHRTEYPSTCRVGEVEIRLDRIAMIGAYFMIMPKSSLRGSPRGRTTYHIISV